jgi:hypothetical protein
MAKNKGRRANVEAKKQAQQEAKEKEKIQQRAVKELQPESAAKKKEVLYQVKTKRDSDVIKAYITFTYRVLHPGVTGRLIFAGILIAAPAIIAKALWLRIVCLVVGGLLVLLVEVVVSTDAYKCAHEQTCYANTNLLQVFLDETFFLYGLLGHSVFLVFCHIFNILLFLLSHKSATKIQQIIRN